MPAHSNFPKFNHGVILRIESLHRRRTNYRRLALNGLGFVVIVAFYTWAALAIFA